MNEAIQQVMTELRGMWRFRWTALIVAWVICLIGWGTVFVMPDQYESEAIFFVGKTRLDDVLSNEGSDRTLIDRVQRQMTLTPVLESVARETDLDLRAPTADAKTRLVENLAEKIEITPLRSRGQRPGNETIFRISYRDVDRAMSKAVVTEVLDTFREDVVSGRATGSDDALQFLESGIAEYGSRLTQQEQELATFKRENVGLLPGEGRGYFETLQAALESTRQMQAELNVLFERRSALQRQLQSENPILPSDVGIGSGLPQNELDARIIELESSIQELLTRYTEKWPDVVSARSQLEQLYKQREEMMETRDEDGLGVASNNPVYQNIQIALNQTSVEIGELERRLATSQAKVTDLQDKIDVIPEVEAKLAELTRDYDQIRSVYTDMRAKYEAENLRRKRLGWDGVTFEVMEPPKASLEPVAPKRTLLLFLVILGALSVGGGIAFLVQQIKPVFVDVASLRRATGLPILGSVNMVWESRHRRQRLRELGAFAGVAALMVLVAVILLVFQDFGVEAGSAVRRMASL